jgi:integrase
MQQRRKRYQTGCVYIDAKTKTWFFRYYVDGRRRAERIGTKAEYPTRTQAMQAAEPIRVRYLVQGESKLTPLTLASIWEGYAREKMPERASTKRSYLLWATNYILPRWGQTPLPDIKARSVELWLSGLKLAPKSKSNIRLVLSVLFEYAMWAELIPIERNPMQLVRIKNASKPGRKARTLRVDEFHRLCSILTEPYRTMAIVSVCLGLRWSELAGLQWQDIDWLGGELTLRRAVVMQITGEVKTVHSAKPLPLDARLLEVLKAHKQRSEYTAATDWVFASPDLNGKKPRSYICFHEKLGRACQDAGIEHVSAHSFRHSYRAWMDELGTPISVQQRAMRHGDIRVTMNVYGDPVNDALKDASSKIAGRAISQLPTKSVS